VAFKDLQKRKEYQLRWQRNMRANLTPEKKAALLSQSNDCRRRQYAANPEIRERASRRNLLHQYNLTILQYEQMVKDQDNKCALCYEDFSTEPRKPVVDHDHETGAVRGILHVKCNTAIGMLRDDAQKCRLAAEYLERYIPKSQARST